MRLSIALIALLFCTAVSKSEIPLVHGENDVWLFNLTTLALDSNWTVANEIHFRRDNWLENMQQLVLRPSIWYNTNEGIQFALGYSYIRTSPYGSFPLPMPVEEHNVWEEITLLHKVLDVGFAHRYRLENRFVDNIVIDSTGPRIDGTRFANRFRYRIAGRYTISKHFFGFAFNELWINLDGLLPENFDRNWLYGGIGYTFSEVYKLQFGYLHQWIRNTADRYEEHPTLQIILDINFD